MEFCTFSPAFPSIPHTLPTNNTPTPIRSPPTPHLHSPQQTQAGPLTFNEGVLAGLDYVLDQARLQGVKVLLVLTDYFAGGAGGPLQYMAFSTTNTSGLSTAEIEALFFSDGQARYRGVAGLPTCLPARRGSA